VVIVKCMLHVSADEQRARLLARLDNEDKYWKFNPSDIDERARWGDYRAAYEIALERTNTEVAPWYVVPSDKKWYRNLVIGGLLLDHLRGMALRWPPADFDVEEQRRRLLDEVPVA
jgi:polyphosphate kinase 2 (PPK2 family)